MLDTLARITLSPVLATQALLVRRMAQSLPEASGAREGSHGQGPQLRLRIIGDSSGAGVGVSHQDKALAGQLTEKLAQQFSVHWHLDALIGATTHSTFVRLETAAPAPTDVIVIALGVNDVTRLTPARLWVRQQQRLYDRLQVLYDPKRIYLSGMPPLEHFPLLPNPLRWTLGRHGKALERRLLAHLRDQSRTVYMPFEIAPNPELIAPDGFHPSAALYTLWADKLAKRIISDWQRG